MLSGSLSKKVSVRMNKNVSSGCVDVSLAKFIKVGVNVKRKVA